MSEIGKSFEELVDIMARLRGPDGCPWDREQTHQTLKKDLIEEAYEAIDAIDAANINELRGELGDLLLQIVFHSQLAKEQGNFGVKDVIDGINTKLIRRHPHVFGDTEVSSADEVVTRWEAIKATEKGHEHRTSALDGVPSQLPGLARAMKISKKAAGVGFEWPNMDAVVDKLDEEVRELKLELSHGDRERISDEIGDILFTVVNIARWNKIDPESALRTMTMRFADRFKYIEEFARESGRSVEDLSIDEMDAVWDRAKQEKEERRRRK